MGIDMFDQPVRIFTHFEEICLFLRIDHFPSAVRTFAIHKLTFRKEGFTRCAILSFIISFVNIPLIIQLFKNLLDLRFMVSICCPDKTIIGCIHQIPDPFNLTGHTIHILLRGYAGLCRFDLHLLTMFIRPRLKTHIIPLSPFKPCNTIGKNNLIRIADMRFSGRIGNRCCYIIRFLCHVFSSHQNYIFIIS